MHWYVVERYHSQLAKLSKTGGGGGVGGRCSPPLPSTDDQMGGANDAEKETAAAPEGEDPSQPLSSMSINNRKWLKGVALNKVQVSGARRNSIDVAESAQPYLSTYERDGLLALIQEMLGSELFIPDTPHTCPNPRQLLEELSEQLQCSNVERMCAVRPTGVGLVPPVQPVSRGGGGMGSRKNRGNVSASSGTPRKRGRKVDDEDSTKSVKAQKKDGKISKRKVALKRRRKPLLVSLPKSLMKGSFDGEREESGSQGDGEITSSKVAVTDDSEQPLNEMEQGVVKDEERLEVIGHESEQLDNIALAGQILTPPMSLSSASADSISPSPSPSPPPLTRSPSS